MHDPETASKHDPDIEAQFKTLQDAYALAKAAEEGADDEFKIATARSAAAHANLVKLRAERSNLGDAMSSMWTKVSKLR